MSDYLEKIINGKEIAYSVKQDIAKEIDNLSKDGLTPGLTVVIVGDDPASQVYVRNKETAAKEAGINSNIIRLKSSTTEEELLSVIDKLNKDKSVHGILCQLPVPKHINEEKVISAIDPLKDVDGFHPINVGRLVTGADTLVSCTPAGIIELLDREQIEILGKEVVIIGRSNIVGKPLFHLFLQKHGTVTVCHSRTKNLAHVCSRADILVAAVGRAKLVKAEFVKEGAVVIDVGINRFDGKLCGDVDFEEVAPICSKITPVPKGVGPMTIAMLMSNTLKAAKMQAANE